MFSGLSGLCPNSERKRVRDCEQRFLLRKRSYEVGRAPFIMRLHRRRTSTTQRRRNMARPDETAGHGIEVFRACLGRRSPIEHGLSSKRQGKSLAKVRERVEGISVAGDEFSSPVLDYSKRTEPVVL